MRAFVYLLAVVAGAALTVTLLLAIAWVSLVAFAVLIVPVIAASIWLGARIPDGSEGLYR